MKILALDSSGLVASVALMEDDRLTAEYSIQYKKTHSQTLLPMMDEVKKMVELDPTSPQFPRLPRHIAALLPAAYMMWPYVFPAYGFYPLFLL